VFPAVKAVWEPAMSDEPAMSAGVSLTPETPLASDFTSEMSDFKA
jgi:hypothetical protein